MVRRCRKKAPDAGVLAPKAFRKAERRSRGPDFTHNRREKESAGRVLYP
jgi:hypothetical protein